jgi:hypothetical protein
MRATAESRHLPVKLTEEELAEKAQELAENVAREEELREEFAAWESTMKEASKAKKAGIYLAHADTVHLGEVVETGVEERLVACTWLYSKENAFLRRDDTGDLVQVRQLRDDERQAVLGETEVIQEPSQEDLLRWTERAGAAVEDGPAECEIRFPSGVVVNLDDKEAAEGAMESFIREHFGR